MVLDMAPEGGRLNHIPYGAVLDKSFPGLSRNL